MVERNAGLPPERRIKFRVGIHLGASTRKARSRRSIGPSRCFRCGLDRSSGAPMTISAMEPLTLFAALDTATGAVIGRCYPRHRGREFLELSARDRAQCPQRPRRPPRDGQLRHSQDASDPQMAGLAAEMACSLHPDRQLLGQSGRTLLRRHHRKANPPRVHRSTAELETAIRSYLDEGGAVPLVGRIRGAQRRGNNRRRRAHDRLRFSDRH